MCHIPSRHTNSAVPWSRRRPHVLELEARIDLTFEVSDSVMARRELLRLLAGRSVVDIDASVLCALAAVGGAIVTDCSGLILAGGAILRHPAEGGETAAGSPRVRGRPPRSPPAGSVRCSR